MADVLYPPGAFHFQVAVTDPDAPRTDVSGSFQEVSGIGGSLEIEDRAEAGENRFTNRIPGPAKHPKLVLKRGVVARKSLLAEWLQATLGSSLANTIATRTVQVVLLNSENSPLVVWEFAKAYPVRWTVAPLQSSHDSLLIETLEFSYDDFERKVRR